LYYISTALVSLNIKNALLAKAKATKPSVHGLYLQGPEFYLSVVTAMWT